MKRPELMHLMALYGDFMQEGIIEGDGYGLLIYCTMADLFTKMTRLHSGFTKHVSLGFGVTECIAFMQQWKDTELGEQHAGAVPIVNAILAKIDMVLKQEKVLNSDLIGKKLIDYKF